MKHTPFTLLVLVAMVGLPEFAFGASQFHGVIMDSQCARVGRHEKMQKGLPNVIQHPSPSLTGEAARKCTLFCVDKGARFVLFDPSSKKVYQLAPNNSARPYAAEQVSVSGTLHDQTIRVEKISVSHDHK